MILPDKYIPYHKSNIYYSDIILGVLSDMKKNRTIEQLWNTFKSKYKDISFVNFYNSVLLLVMLNLLEMNKDGELIEISKNGNN